MGDIRDNISRYEMACRCGQCNFVAADTELMDVLQDVTDHFNEEYPSTGYHYSKVILQITSGNRCFLHNETVQEEFYSTRGKHYTAGTSKSSHMDGVAADFKLWFIDKAGRKHQISVVAIRDYLDKKYPNKYGIGRYHNRVHIDVKPGPARRWNG